MRKLINKLANTFHNIVDRIRRSKKTTLFASALAIGESIFHGILTASAAYVLFFSGHVWLGILLAVWVFVEVFTPIYLSWEATR